MKVFVYGTLRTGLPYHGFMMEECKGKFIDKGKTKLKYGLFVHNYLPCVLDIPIVQINGEVYEVSENYIQYLDDLESLYKRKSIEIIGENGNYVAEMYFYKFITLIKNGDFKNSKVGKYLQKCCR